MRSETVHIESLHLRVPGMNRAQAASFGEEVARGLQQGFTAQQNSEQIGSVELRITAPDGAPRDRLAAMVAEKILLALRR
jgi:hypothetical protein